MTATDWRLLLFRLERAGDPKRIVTRDELQSCCREAKYAILELIAEGERKPQ